MKIYLDDAEMDAQLGRTLIAANSRSADIGETLATANRVVAGDYGSWFEQWSATAAEVHARGQAALAAGHRVTARQSFLRATEYWRQAIFFIRHDLDDERLQAGWRAHRESFRAAIALFDHEVITADIPFEGVTMSTYLFRAPVAAGATGRPVVLAPCGYDSTAEAGYSATAYMALEHGYDCVVWDGPGQGQMLYEHRVPMRPDFETVLAPVVDWVLGQPDIDPARVAVIGRSFAGYLGPRRGQRRTPHRGVGVRPRSVRLRLPARGQAVRRGALAADPRGGPRHRCRARRHARRPAPGRVLRCPDGDDGRHLGR